MRTIWDERACEVCEKSLGMAVPGDDGGDSHLVCSKKCASVVMLRLRRERAKWKKKWSGHKPSPITITHFDDALKQLYKPENFRLAIYERPMFNLRK